MCVLSYPGLVKMDTQKLLCEDGLFLSSGVRSHTKKFFEVMKPPIRFGDKKKEEKNVSFCTYSMS